MTCGTDSGSRLGSRATPDEIKNNLTAIANILASVKDATSSNANVGISAVACEAQSAFKKAAGYYFNMVQQDLSTITSDVDFIIEFFKDIFGYTQSITTPVDLWIDQVDETFQELACFVNTPDGSQSRIWRTLSKHSSLHAGLNTIQSIQNVANVNVILRIIELILTTVITDLHQQYTNWITSSGTIIQGWTQAWRLCSTKWEIGNLERPEDEEPDDDDEDDWLPRYAIYVTEGTSQTLLKGLEHALGGDGWELSTSSYDASLPNGYVVDLNPLQAQLPSLMPFVDWTNKKVWDGHGSGVTYNRVIPKDNGSFESTARMSRDEKRQAPFYPAPTGSDMLVVNGLGNNLKLLSQQKGLGVSQYDYYTYRHPRKQPSLPLPGDIVASLEGLQD